MLHFFSSFIHPILLIWHAWELGGVWNLARIDHWLQSQLPLNLWKNPHRLMMGKMVLPLFLSCSWSDPFHTCKMNPYIRPKMSLKYSQIKPQTTVTCPWVAKELMFALFVCCCLFDPCKICRYWGHAWCLEVVWISNTSDHIIWSNLPLKV